MNLHTRGDLPMEAALSTPATAVGRLPEVPPIRSRRLTTDRRRIVQQEVAWTAMRVIRVRNGCGRRPWIDRLLGTTMDPLHSRVVAIGQSAHHLTPTDAAWSTRGAVARCSAMGAKVTAVVQTTLLPTDRTGHATCATPAIAITTSGKLAE